MNVRSFLPALLALSLPLHAQKMQNAAGEAPGPWLLGTIGVGNGADPKTPKTTALKGFAVKVGEKGEAAVAYDLDLCRMVGAWRGGKFVAPMNLMSRGEYPTALGEVAFTAGEVPGFISGETKQGWKDPRPEPFGPLPEGHARFRGFVTAGGRPSLQWTISGRTISETAGFEVRQGIGFFTRELEIGANADPLSLPLCSIPELAFAAPDAALPELRLDAHGERAGYRAVRFEGKPHGLFVEAWGVPDSATLRSLDGQLVLVLPPSTKAMRIKIVYARLEDADKERIEDVANTVSVPGPIAAGSLSGTDSKAKGVEVITEGDISADTGSAYVVDTIKLPDPNPWGAPMFTSGFDFFEDGRAAVCTFHGDVFVVSGIDEKLEKVTSRRFATGLYHPLGLKIVKGEVYVTCRDGIWRLKDLNGDGEADFYEAFSFDVKVTKSFHEFVFDLQTDPTGNFYFAKAGPVKNGGRGFDEIMAHHGTLMRVSPDGAKLDVIATGFRAPNGIGVGPRGELTSGDNEGTWTPACKINWIKPGGFYGVVDLAHRPTPPTNYDPPLCWLPKRLDNSGGGQVWVPEGDRWGPWGGQMLHLSYGQSALYGVLKEEVNVSGVPLMQGGVTKFPLQFQSGIMRGRFNPKDGQLYVIGLRGWQTNGLKNGAFQRVRYTGAVPRMPIEMHVRKDGIELRFACSLDTQTARDPQNWNLEKWRYVWSSAYGSPELSTEEPEVKPGELGKDGRPEFTKAQAEQRKHDAVGVKSVSVGTDDRTVFLEMPGLQPTMQMAIQYDLKASDGQELRGEVVQTIHGFSGE